MAAEWRYTKEGLFELIWEGICVMRAHGEGRHRDGRKIDTRTARLVEQKKAERGQAGQKAKAPGGLWLKFCDANGLCLEERLEISPEGGACGLLYFVGCGGKGRGDQSADADGSAGAGKGAAGGMEKHLVKNAFGSL